MRRKFRNLDELSRDRRSRREDEARAGPGGGTATSPAGLGPSFLGEQHEQTTEHPIWQRYVEDRMRHFTISHR